MFSISFWLLPFIMERSQNIKCVVTVPGSVPSAAVTSREEQTRILVQTLTH